MKRKILFFLMNGVGGAERITITIAKFFDTNNYDIKCVLVQKGDDEIIKFIPQNIPILSIPCRHIYMSTLSIKKLLKKEKPNIVFCSSPAINARLIIAAKLCGNIRVVVRNSNMFSFERKDVQVLVKLTYPFADKIILQQDEMKADFLKRVSTIKPEKAITLYNPIDIEHIKKGITAPNPFPEKDNINYLWVARFAYEKAQDILVRAFSLVHKKQSNAHLWLIGRYNPENEFASSVVTYVKNNGLEDFVHFVGHDDNPYKWMKHCDCFVLPSRNEGLPNVMLEAMYLERPVVASRCLKIINDLIIEGENGYSVGVGDIENLASYMLKAVKIKKCHMIYNASSKEDFIKTIVG